MLRSVQCAVCSACSAWCLVMTHHPSWVKILLYQNHLDVIQPGKAFAQVGRRELWSGVTVVADPNVADLSRLLVDGGGFRRRAKRISDEQTCVRACVRACVGAQFVKQFDQVQITLAGKIAN